jgi:RNA polymerase sigma-70 factor (ECF subfamily)
VDETQAIAQLKQGDINGLEALVYLYQLKAIRAACLIVGDQSLAEDIVQRAFLRAAERIDTFDAQRSFGPWFLRSVVNDAIKAVSRQKRVVPLDSENFEETLDLVDPTPMPEELVESEETRQAVWQAVKQLPAKQRAAIVMLYYLGMPEDQMMEELHGPLGTIKWWLFSARQRLKKKLNHDDIFENSTTAGWGTRHGDDREMEDKP